jgi:threonine aldolase
MRQSGILAAAALHALAHHRERLADDHAHARLLAEGLAQIPEVRVDVASVETNLVNIDLEVAADEVVGKARDRGLLILASGRTRLRAVTHLDVSRQDIAAAIDILTAVLSDARETMV